MEKQCGFNTYIINCYNLADIPYSSKSSGICADVYAPTNTVNLYIKNCYNKGTVLGELAAGITTIYNPNNITANVENAYYLEASANIGVYHFETETDLENPQYE